MNEKLDVTERATAAGWTLPEGWHVRAWTVPDEDITDPRDEGDVYRTDVDEEDYDHPTRAFCTYCANWIRVNEFGIWHVQGEGIGCPSNIFGGHRPDEPLAVKWWREDRWSFVGVLVEVTDAAGREWGEDALWGVEAGDFPVKIDRETGQVESRNIDPLQDADHPLPDLIDQALSEAQAELKKHAKALPVITHTAS